MQRTIKLCAVPTARDGYTTLQSLQTPKKIPSNALLSFEIRSAFTANAIELSCIVGRTFYLKDFLSTRAESNKRGTLLNRFASAINMKMMLLTIITVCEIYCSCMVHDWIKRGMMSDGMMLPKPMMCE